MRSLNFDELNQVSGGFSWGGWQGADDYRVPDNGLPGTRSSPISLPGGGSGKRAKGEPTWMPKTSITSHSKVNSLTNIPLPNFEPEKPR